MNPQQRFINHTNMNSTFNYGIQPQYSDAYQSLNSHCRPPLPLPNLSVPPLPPHPPIYNVPPPQSFGISKPPPALSQSQFPYNYQNSSMPKQVNTGYDDANSFTANGNSGSGNYSHASSSHLNSPYTDFNNTNTNHIQNNMRPYQNSSRNLGALSSHSFREKVPTSYDESRNDVYGRRRSRSPFESREYRRYNSPNRRRSRSPDNRNSSFRRKTSRSSPYKSTQRISPYRRSPMRKSPPRISSHSRSSSFKGSPPRNHRRSSSRNDSYEASKRISSRSRDNISSGRSSKFANSISSSKPIVKISANSSTSSEPKSRDNISSSRNSRPNGDISSLSTLDRADKKSNLSESENDKSAFEEVKAAWVRSAPADLYYCRDENNPKVMKATPRLVKLCEKFNEDLIQRAQRARERNEKERANQTQESNNEEAICDKSEPSPQTKTPISSECSNNISIDESNKPVSGSKKEECRDNCQIKESKCSSKCNSAHEKKKKSNTRGRKGKKSCASTSSSSDSDDGGSSCLSSEDDEDWALRGAKKMEKKNSHPDRLHPELWSNDHGEMNDGPVCRCSLKARRSGIRHGYFAGEDPLTTCDMWTNNSDRLYHYLVTISRPTNFLVVF